MSQREIDHAAAIIRATPIELEPEQQPAEPDPFHWMSGLIAGAFVALCVILPVIAKGV
jgi:hypothetical protein